MLFQWPYVVSSKSDIHSLEIQSLRICCSKKINEKKKSQNLKAAYEAIEKSMQVFFKVEGEGL